MALMAVMLLALPPLSMTPPSEPGRTSQANDPIVFSPGDPPLVSAPRQTAQTLGSEIVVRARTPHGNREDPLAPFNEKSFEVAQKVDQAIVGPIAHDYQRDVPGPIRDGVRNFLNNTREPVVFLSYLLELKPGKASETAGRFAINTVAGIVGLFDIARRKPFHLPRHPNGFADAMGYYGIKPGPYFFLPLIGPTTLRDAVGGSLDRSILPLAIGVPFNQPAYAITTGAASALDRRVAFEGDLQTIREAGNPYVTRRDLYLRQRQAEISGLHRTSWQAAHPHP